MQLFNYIPWGYTQVLLARLALHKAMRNLSVSHYNIMIVNRCTCYLYIYNSVALSVCRCDCDCSAGPLAA